MPKLFIDANPRYVAYVLDGGGSGYQELPPGHTSVEAEYLAVVYGLNEYFLMWNKELDARQSDLDTEKLRATGEEEFYKVGSVVAHTKQPLPPPVMVCSDNEVVVKQLSRQYHIANDRLRKLAGQVWAMTKNIDVKFEWIPRNENLAGKMLP